MQINTQPFNITIMFNKHENYGKKEIIVVWVSIFCVLTLMLFVFELKQREAFLVTSGRYKGQIVYQVKRSFFTDSVRFKLMRNGEMKEIYGNVNMEKINGPRKYKLTK